MRAVSADWIGLFGVVVGGVIATAWSWLAVVRQELSDAIVAARLVDESLATLQHGVEAGDSFARVWENNRAALARALGEQQWEAVSIVYRNPGPVGAEAVSRAREVLKRPVAGKRFLVLQRVGNVIHPSRWRETVYGTASPQYRLLNESRTPPAGSSRGRGRSRCIGRLSG